MHAHESLGGVPKHNMPQRHRTWQTEADVGVRRMIVEKILLLFQKRKPRVSPEWQQRLPDFVKRLEESLYRDALSKEEYADTSTLEQRLQAVAKRIGPIRSNSNFAAQGASGPSPSSSMMLTPGAASSISGIGSTMIPTPGRDIAKLPNPGTGAMNVGGASNMTISAPNPNVGKMVPTPGLGPEALHSHPRQSFSSGLSGHMNQDSNGYRHASGGYVSIGGHSAGMQPVNNGQMKMQKSSSNLGYSNASLYVKSGNHLQQPARRYDGFSTELVGTGALYNGNSGVSSGSVGVPLSGSQPSRMIPVPGLHPQDQQTKTLVKTLGSSTKQPLNTKPLQVQVPSEPEDRKPAGLGLQDDGIQIKVKPCSASASLRQPSAEDSQPPQLLQQSHKATLQQQHNLSNEQITHTSNSSAQLLKYQARPYEEVPPPQNLSEERGGHQAERPVKTVSKLSCGEVPQGSSQVAEKKNPTSTNTASVSNVDGQGSQQFLKQQRWLLFLLHAKHCSAPEGQCQQTPHCHTAKQLWAHIMKCTDKDCQYPRCKASVILKRHHESCNDLRCPVCVSVRLEILKTQPGQNPSLQKNNSAISSIGPVVGHIQTIKHLTSPVGPMEPPAKRVKVESSEPNNSIDTLVISTESTATHVKNVSNLNSISAEKSDSGVEKCDSNSTSSNNSGSERVCKAGSSDNLPSKALMQIKQEIKEAIPSSFSVGDHASNVKGCKSKNRGVSLIELFTPEQIKEHIRSLRQCVGQIKAKPEKNQAMDHKVNENSCQLCAVETLTFDPPPIYCSPCGARIKRNAFYWTMQCGETRHYFCIQCYNDARNDSLEVEGQTYPKTKLEKRRNDEEIDEPWVQCDKCEKWQHQICALFNMRRNEGGEAEYTCPQCLLEEMHKGERKPLPQSSVLGAKDLPKTLLSDHIEQRLTRSLKNERQERAQAQGKSYDEVPGAESLVVRVVSSVEKKLEVKPRFLETFQHEDYTTSFPYKSKVLLLFQKIEGVEVCLFGMYVQEFGAESPQPNQRRIYLSYLDSVKYFRPDVRTVNGEALRTFVYHEILIAYLDYCKERGFTSCYIWACPPLKGEDYILYCHPEIQKTPKSDKLREWYLTMLSKATSEGIVVKVTNMYDYFFVCSGETKAKVTAMHLPYFDGDYWPGAAEDMLFLLQDEENGRRQQKKGKTKTATKRSSKGAAQAELLSNASKDLQLMQKLGESIHPMKEDFIMVHMQHACTHCCNFILSGHRWSCKQCKEFNICDGCYALEQTRDEWDKHPTNSKGGHQLFPVSISAYDYAMKLDQASDRILEQQIETETFPDTKDKDEIMESEFFDTRQAFLSLCQGNHYQYDTLRRAKNSSMMVLYHLHNPTAPAYVTTCNICHHDIETGQGWRCETCPDFDICNSCHSNEDSVKHPHKLVAHPSATERDAQSKEARQQRVLQLRKMLYLLVHASQCGSPQCQYPNCRRVKGLFRHGLTCRIRASGGCHLCMKMWYLLQLHARACKEAECRVPRCKDLKEHQRRAQHQMESRRRAAVMEMMRQRVAASGGKS